METKKEYKGVLMPEGSKSRQRRSLSRGEREKTATTGESPAGKGNQGKKKIPSCTSHGKVPSDGGNTGWVKRKKTAIFRANQVLGRNGQKRGIKKL